MSEANREIQELLVDYADALRDGSIPVFLKSLTSVEAKTITTSRQFWDATEIVQFLNGAGFADKAVTPNVGLFISRVDAEITSRLKQAKAVPQRKYHSGTKPAPKIENTSEESI
jgi:hypothetical protein